MELVQDLALEELEVPEEPVVLVVRGLQDTGKNSHLHMAGKGYCQGNTVVLDCRGCSILHHCMESSHRLQLHPHYSKLPNNGCHH